MTSTDVAASAVITANPKDLMIARPVPALPETTGSMLAIERRKSVSEVRPRTLLKHRDHEEGIDKIRTTDNQISCQR